MWPLLRALLLDRVLQSVSSVTTPTTPDSSPEIEQPEPESTMLRTVGWVSAGLGALAIGMFVGRELRQRYKFNRRTPYDFYEHAGDEVNDMEFGVGV